MYVARDINGTLALFERKPRKNKSCYSPRRYYDRKMILCHDYKICPTLAFEDGARKIYDIVFDRG